MSLPWFPFYADAYTGDTGHLTCEEHGAYLQLILAYYRSEKPLPGSDRALASLVKLPMDRWAECKPALAPFFRAEGGFWHHDRIEEEIKERNAKHAKGTAKAKVAAAARHNKAGSKLAPSIAPSKPEASKNPAHLHLHLQSPSGREEPPPPKLDVSVGSKIDRGFQPNEEAIERAHDQGAADADIDTELRKFVAHHGSKGSFSANWDDSWAKWWEGWKPHRAKEAAKAPPRIEVNSGPARAEIGYKPSEAEFDRAAMLFAQNSSHWSSQMGPEPGMSGCKCPPEILTKHGIDPKTGLKIRQVG